jgi:hypothetical protein
MATIHVIWTDAHDEWVDVELDNYILSAPVKLTDVNGVDYAVWSGEGITEAHADAVGAGWGEEPIVLPDPTAIEPELAQPLKSVWK